MYFKYNSPIKVSVRRIDMRKKWIVLLIGCLLLGSICVIKISWKPNLEQSVIIIREAYQKLELDSEWYGLWVSDSSRDARMGRIAFRWKDVCCNQYSKRNFGKDEYRNIDRKYIDPPTSVYQFDIVCRFRREARLRTVFTFLYGCAGAIQEKGCRDYFSIQTDGNSNQFCWRQNSQILFGKRRSSEILVWKG